MIDFILAGQTLGEHAREKGLLACVSVTGGAYSYDISIQVFEDDDDLPDIYLKHATIESFPEDITAAHEAIDNYES